MKRTNRQTLYHPPRRPLAPRVNSVDHIHHPNEAVLPTKPPPGQDLSDLPILPPSLERISLFHDNHKTQAKEPATATHSLATNGPSEMNTTTSPYFDSTRTNGHMNTPQSSPVGKRTTNESPSAMMSSMATSNTAQQQPSIKRRKGTPHVVRRRNSNEDTAVTNNTATSYLRSTTSQSYTNPTQSSLSRSYLPNALFGGSRTTSSSSSLPLAPPPPRPSRQRRRRHLAGRWGDQEEEEEDDAPDNELFSWQDKLDACHSERERMALYWNWLYPDEQVPQMNCTEKAIGDAGSARPVKSCLKVGSVPNPVGTVIQSDDDPAYHSPEQTEATSTYPDDPVLTYLTPRAVSQDVDPTTSVTETPRVSNRSRVQFGPSQAMEFVRDLPSTSMTPLSSEEAAERFPLDKQEPTVEEEIMVQETKENTQILGAWDDVAPDDDFNIFQDFDDDEYMNDRSHSRNLSLFQEEDFPAPPSRSKDRRQSHLFSPTPGVPLFNMEDHEDDPVMGLLSPSKPAALLTSSTTATKAGSPGLEGRLQCLAFSADSEESPNEEKENVTNHSVTKDTSHCHLGSPGKEPVDTEMKDDSIPAAALWDTVMSGDPSKIQLDQLNMTSVDALFTLALDPKNQAVSSETLLIEVMESTPSLRDVFQAFLSAFVDLRAMDRMSRNHESQPTPLPVAERAWLKLDLLALETRFGPLLQELRRKISKSHNELSLALQALDSMKMSGRTNGPEKIKILRDSLASLEEERKAAAEVLRNRKLRCTALANCIRTSLLHNAHETLSCSTVSVTDDIISTLFPGLLHGLSVKVSSNWAGCILNKPTIETETSISDTVTTELRQDLQIADDSIAATFYRAMLTSLLATTCFEKYQTVNAADYIRMVEIAIGRLHDTIIDLDRCISLHDLDAAVAGGMESEVILSMERRGTVKLQVTYDPRNQPAVLATKPGNIVVFEASTGELIDESLSTEVRRLIGCQFLQPACDYLWRRDRSIALPTR